ncbi:MAG: PEP-CTERM sorting domain-containing protein [Pseudomonadales bacterium]|nr:PEP-CTERM sorting domain-containing protein [Pseudomonadales bacterium]
MNVLKILPWTATTIAAGLLWATAASAVPVNLLTNAGFETGDYTGWDVGGNTINNAVDVDGTLITGTNSFFGTTLSNVRSGTFSSYHVGQGNPTEFITLTQTIAVQQGDTISAGFWIGNDSASLFSTAHDDLKTQIFIDGVGILGGTTTFVPAGSDASDFVEIASSFNTGTRNSVTVTYQVAGSGTIRAGVSLDDLFFVGEAATVPEPGMLALLMFGLAGVRLTQRRQTA